MVLKAVGCGFKSRHLKFNTSFIAFNDYLQEITGQVEGSSLDVAVLIKVLTKNLGECHFTNF